MIKNYIGNGTVKELFCCTVYMIFLGWGQVIASVARPALGAPITVEPGGSLIINSYSHMYPIILSHPGTVNVQVVPDQIKVHSGPLFNPSPKAFPGELSENSVVTIRSKLLNSCQECWQTVLDQLRPHLLKTSSLYAHIKENKWSLGLKGLAAAYVIFSVMLFRMASFLSASQRWMYWKSDLLLVQMMRMAPADIMQELLAALSVRTPLLPDQKPFQIILAELDDEICQLQRYVRWADRIIKLSYAQRHCAASAELWMPSVLGVPLGYAVRLILGFVNLKNIIYINDDLVQRAPEYLRRLMYLRRIVEEELVIELPQTGCADPASSIRT